jgi:hypothetical protein
MAPTPFGWEDSITKRARRKKARFERTSTRTQTRSLIFGTCRKFKRGARGGVSYVVRDARDRVEAIGDALQEIERKIADATTKLAELRDRAERAELARAIEADVSVLAEARDAFAAAAERLIRG